jgi:hypothetical protein
MSMKICDFKVEENESENRFSKFSSVCQILLLLLLLLFKRWKYLAFQLNYDLTKLHIQNFANKQIKLAFPNGFY